MLFVSRALFLVGCATLIGGCGATAATEDVHPEGDALVQAAPAAASAGARTFNGVASESLLYVLVYKDPETIGAGLSHDHVVRASGWSGSFKWDPAEPQTCNVNIKVPVAKLVPDEDHMRKKTGLDGLVKESDRDKIKKAMLGSDQLDGSKFPNISFNGTKCVPTANGVKVSGMFKLRGKSRPLATVMKLDMNGKRLTATGTFKLKATDFGFEPFSAGFGALKNQNEMKFSIRFVGDAK